MATLKDVAKLANVDVSTVSRAINNTGHVHPATKAKIMKAVEKLSYKPNLLAQGLKKGKRNTIAVIVPRLRTSVFSEITEAIETRASAGGYATIIVTTNGDPDTEEEALQRLRVGLVDGIIIAGTGQNNRLLRDIAADGIQIVQVIRRQVDTLPSIVSDYYDNGRSSVHYLYQRGCRHIGIILGSMEIEPFHDRYKGYQKEMKKLKLPENKYASASRNDPGYTDGYEGTRQLLANDPELDGILAASDVQAIAAMRYLGEQGISVPQQVRVISMTGSRLSRILPIALTANTIPSEEIGTAAVDMLTRFIDAPEDQRPSVQHVIFQASLTQRESA